MYLSNEIWYRVWTQGDVPKWKIGHSGPAKADHYDSTCYIYLFGRGFVNFRPAFLSGTFFCAELRYKWFSYLNINDLLSK